MAASRQLRHFEHSKKRCADPHSSFGSFKNTHFTVHFITRQPYFEWSSFPVSQNNPTNHSNPMHNPNCVRYGPCAMHGGWWWMAFVLTLANQWIQFTSGHFGSKELFSCCIMRVTLMHDIFTWIDAFGNFHVTLFDFAFSRALIYFSLRSTSNISISCDIPKWPAHTLVNESC